jgi:hypothetical protein
VSERWCPRCDVIDDEGSQRCPTCDAPTLPVDDPAASDATVDGTGAGGVGHASARAIPPMSPGSAVPAVGTATVRHPGGDERGPLGLEDPMDARPEDSAGAGRRRGPAIGLTGLVGAAVPLVVVLAVISSSLSRTPGSVALEGPGPTAHPSAPAGPSGAPDGTGVPPRLAFIANGVAGRPGGLAVARGAGTEPVVVVPGGVRAVSFTWSPDGAHLAVVDDRGALRLLPEGARLQGPIRDLAFSHDGRLIAVCRGAAAHPTTAVYRAGAGLEPLIAAFPGCDPAWSPDDAHVAFLIGGSPGSPQHRGLLDVHRGVRSPVPGAGPVIWAPPARYPLTPLTTLTSDCTAVQVMDADGRGASRVASIPFVSPRRSGSAEGCQVTAMTWSTDARWLAVVIRPRDGSPDRVLVFEALTHIMIALPIGARGLVPTALSWSPGASTLMVSGHGAYGEPLALLSVPAGGEPDVWLHAADTSWSEDGSWILGRDMAGWAAFGANDPTLRVPLPAVPDDARGAAWCCPEIGPVRVP